MSGVRPLIASLLIASGLAQAESPDPYLWLEEVQGAPALKFAQEHSERTEARLRAEPGFEALLGQMREVIASPQRLAPVERIGGQLYNFWRDDAHPRGLWRRSPEKDYLRGHPRWQTVLDLDALAAAEHESWTWAGANCIGLPRQRCLISLSRGGGDAHVLREYDPVARRFVQGGFQLPEAKGGASWIDADTLAVATVTDADSATESGYPRRLQLWKRGQALAQATLLLETPKDEVGLWTWNETAGRTIELVVERRIGFFTGKQLLWREGRLVELPKPDTDQATPMGEDLLIESRADWNFGGQTHPAGSLLLVNLNEFLQGRAQVQRLFTPEPRRALRTVVATAGAVQAVVQDEQGQSLHEWQRKGSEWVARQVATPPGLTLQLRSYDGRDSSRYWLTTTGFLQPSQTNLGQTGRDSLRAVQNLPALFDASTHEVERLQARAEDGTSIPYWLVHPKGARPEGGWPTVLYGYGGFAIALNPSYSGILGRAWLSRGGAYVLSNIRGGGEFGPKWHQSAQKEHRQRSFSDFTQVAADVVARGISSPKKLGILGGSLGGLLTSVALTQRPDLFGAVVSQVPLTDMKRYHRLLAGHSWIAEYGDPDVPEQWAYIGAYSPYQRAQASPAYPPVLYTSSTLDDRVHPGHARKMVARLEELGQPVWYWENREGGHAGASDPGRQALLWALSYGFFRQQLMPSNAVAKAVQESHQ